ncbi:hypothetical protein NMG60_11014381 [Bertholletia excelsa]
MDSSLVKAKKNLKRAESRKSHSWWWDSHTSPKNSKWLAENLEEMDQSVKKMLKLIEEDGDSFAMKAEMYYQKRPELISLVEDFYRMYRSLAERYDHVTGELRKNIPSDLQSQSSGISDMGSEPPTRCPSPDRRPSRRKPTPRAAGFDFFLGGNKEGDESSTLDSEYESDDSSVIINYPMVPGNERGLRRKTTEENADSEDLSVMARYEEELKSAREKIKLSAEEISRLKIEIQKYRSHECFKNLEDELELPETDVKILELEEELEITKEKLQDSETETENLRHEVGEAENVIAMWKESLDEERSEVSKLQDQIERYEANLSERDQEIRVLKETISSASQTLSAEKTRLQAEIHKLSEEHTFLEDNLKGWKLRCQSLEAEIDESKAAFKLHHDSLIAERDKLKEKVDELISEVSSRDDQIEHMDRHLKELHMEYVKMVGTTEAACRKADKLNSTIKELEEEVENQRKVIEEGAEEKREAIRQLCFSLEHYRKGYHMLRESFMGHKRLP